MQQQGGRLLLQCRDGQALGLTAAGTQPCAFGDKRVHQDVRRLHQHFLLLFDLHAVGLHRQAHHHDRGLFHRQDLRDGRVAAFRLRARREQLALQRLCSRDQRQPTLERTFHDHARHQQPVDFVGALKDAVDTGVAVVALGGIVVYKTVAAVDLDVFVQHVVDHLAAGDLED